MPILKTKRKLIIVPLLVAGLLAGLAQFLFANREPVYHGRNFSSWFQAARRVPVSTGENNPALAIQSMGRPAIPLLLKQIGTDDSRSLTFYRRKYPKIPVALRRFLPVPTMPFSRQLTAASLLTAMGPPAREFIPEVIAIFDRYYIRQNRLPPSSRIVWSEQLGGALPAMAPPFPEFWLQTQLLRIVATVGSDDPEIIPLLLSGYRMHIPVWLPDDYTNLQVAIKRSEPLLLTNVSNPDPSVRMVTIGMLGTLATEHPELAPVFTKAIEDTNIAVQRAGLLGLEKTKPQFEPTLPVIVRLLDETNAFVTQPARQLFLGMGGGLKLFGRLNDALASTNAEVRAAAARLLRDYPKRAEIARPRLMEHTNAAVEPDEAVRREAAATLERMDRPESSKN